MRSITILSLLMLSVSAWAGTFKDDFEDGNWDGWEAIVWENFAANAEERISIVDGVLRMDGVNKPQPSVDLRIMKDWKDYSFAADMKNVQIEPGTP